MAISLKEPGMVLSGASHALALAAMLYGFSSAKPFEEVAESVAVDVISESQFNEMIKGDKESKDIRKEVALRVDRVAPVEEKKDPGEDKRDAPTPPPPPLRPSVKAAEEDEDEEKPVPNPPRIPTPPKPEVKQAVATPPKPPEKVEKEEVEKDAEVVKKAAVVPPKPPEKKEPPKEDPAQKLLEQQKADEAKKKAEELKKLEEAKKKAAETARKLAEAKKAEEERKAKEKAESERLQAAIRNRLLVSRDTPAASGSTGQQVQRTASAGATTATGSRLSPSDRSALMGMLQDQMNRCLSVNITQAPRTKPAVRIGLAPNGTLNVQPVLTNSSGEPGFQALAEAGMRAIRQCAPYRIPARFADTYNDWKTVTVAIDPSDLL